MDLSTQLKKAREEAGLSQADVSEKINLSRQAISRWENGRSTPDVETLILLSDLYNVSLDYLAKGEMPLENPSPEKSQHSLSAETLGISVVAMLTCGIPILGLIVNTILIGYCLHKKQKMDWIYKLILAVFFILSLYNTGVYINYSFFSIGTATLEKVAFLNFRNF